MKLIRALNREYGVEMKIKELFKASNFSEIYLLLRRDKVVNKLYELSPQQKGIWSRIQQYRENNEYLIPLVIQLDEGIKRRC